MALDLEALQKLNAKKQYLIIGYFRENQQILTNIHGNNPYYNIPKLSMWITLAYHSSYKYEILPFDPNFKSQQVIFSNDNKTAYSPTSGWLHTLAGGEPVDATNGEATWRLNVISILIYHKCRIVINSIYLI